MFSCVYKLIILEIVYVHFAIREFVFFIGSWAIVNVVSIAFEVCCLPFIFLLL